MAVKAIKHDTPINLTGNFDIAVIGVPSVQGKAVQLQRSLGADTENWKTIKVFGGEASEVVVNIGENSFKLAEEIDGVDVTCNQV